MIGIYKITNPKGKIYIGQSVNIKSRFYMYKMLHCKSQPKLYNSLLKYGSEKHTFEILEECDISELNHKERYYQDYFNVLLNGLNCMLTKSDDSSGRKSLECIAKRINTMKNNKKVYNCTNEDRFDLYTQTKYANLIGKSTAWVSKLIRKNKLDNVLEVNGCVLIKVS